MRRQDLSLVKMIGKFEEALANPKMQSPFKEMKSDRSKGGEMFSNLVCIMVKNTDSGVH